MPPADSDTPTVFYSWQSDSPNSTNRSFIADCIDKALKELSREGVAVVLAVRDQDTQGVTGTPDIRESILEKIDRCSVFVGDVTIINPDDEGEPGKRLTPNPNVLFETGYAVKALGWERVLLVINTAACDRDLLPFDLKVRRLVEYELDAEANKSNAKSSLAMKFKKQLQYLLEPHDTEHAIEVFFADPKTQEAMGSGIQAGTLLWVLRDGEKMPRYAPKSEGLGVANIAFLSTDDRQPNPDYYEEILEFHRYHNGMVPLAIGVRNVGDKMLSEVKLVIEFDESDRHLLASQEPHEPLSRFSRLGDHRRLAPTFQGTRIQEPVIKELGGKRRLTIPFGNIQIGETVVSDEFRYGALQPGNFLIDGSVFCDQLRPMPFKLEVALEVDVHEISAEDIRNVARKILNDAY